MLDGYILGREIMRKYVYIYEDVTLAFYDEPLTAKKKTRILRLLNLGKHHWRKKINKVDSATFNTQRIAQSIKV